MKLKTLFVLGLLFLTSLNIVVADDPVEININALDIQANQEDWEENGEITFQSEGINITIKNKFTKIQFIFRETYGRDVRLNFYVPSAYISPSVLGLIKTDDNVTIDWRTTSNDTILSFEMHAYQTVTLEISKLNLAKGSMKKRVHDFWNYVEYNGEAVENEDNVVVLINKEEPSFEIDNKHIRVQYKTEFFGWYYPVDDVSSKDVYYYMDDVGYQYRVVTKFKSDQSADVKIHAFPGASEGWFNKDAITGKLAKVFIDLEIGVKKTIMDLFGNNKPAYRGG